MRLKSDHDLAIEGSRLAGTLGEEIETQNHGSARRHSVNQPLRQSWEHLIRLVGQHRVGISKLEIDRKDSGVDRDLCTRVP